MSSVRPPVACPRGLRRALALALVAAPAVGAAQEAPVTLQFLEIPTSPAVNALAGAGVALPSADPYASLYNPAHVGLAARDVTVATAAYPGARAWLAVGDLALGSMATTVGADLTPRGLPVAVGLGFAQTTLSYGERQVPGSEGTAKYEPADRYRAFTAGASSTGPVRLALGATMRHVTASDGAEMVEGAAEERSAQGLTLDLGALLAADVAALAGHPTLRLPALGPVRPALEATVGYAQAHVGGRVRFGEGPWQSLPRTARLGWSLAAGLDRPLGAAGALRLVGAEATVQAEASLVRPGESDGAFAYAPVLGDLDPLQNALLGRGSETATARRGLRVTLLETVAFSRGGFDGWGFSDARTRGVEVRLAGALKAAAALSGSGVLAAAARRFDLRYTHTTYFAGAPNESTLGGFTLVLRR